jgi:hypothetical protein
MPANKKLHNQPTNGENKPINKQNCGSVSQPATETIHLSSAHTSVLKKKKKRLHIQQTNQTHSQPASNQL